MAGQLSYHIACLRYPVCHVSRQRIGVSVYELDEIVFADIERFLQMISQVVQDEGFAAELQRDRLPGPDDVLPAGLGKSAGSESK